MRARLRFAAIALAATACGAALAGCYGDTDEVQYVQTRSARLSAHGTANNGPAFSYFEYWKTATPNDRLRTQTRNWPAKASSPFYEDVSGLTGDTAYSFRICGGDAGAQAVCGNVRSFRTSAGDSVVYRRGTALEFYAATGTTQNLDIDEIGGVIDFGASVVPYGPPCTQFGGSPLRFAAVTCPFYGVTRFRVHLRDGNDTGAGYLRYVMGIPMTVDGASGDDRVLGGYGGDYLVGGPGHDTFSASNGDDTIDAQDGEPDSGSCGAGTDTVYADPSGDDFATAGDCEVITTTPAPPPP